MSLTTATTVAPVSLVTWAWALTAIFAVLAVVEGLVLVAVLMKWRAANRASPSRLRKESSVGTLVWLRGSDRGQLDSIARFEFQALTPRRLWDTARWLLGQTGWHRRHRSMPPGVARPTGKFADDVANEARIRLDEPWLRNHSMRTYAIAALYGTKRGYAFDEELLWAACMLHAAGLRASPPSGYGPPSAMRPAGVVVDECFTIRSADIAASVAAAHNRSPEWIYRLREAIVLHLNPAVSKSLGIEAWLLNVAVTIDLTGLGYQKVYSDAIDRVYLQCPLLDQQEAVLEALATEGRDNPRCRAAALGRLGVGRFHVVPWLVQKSPIYTLYSLQLVAPDPASRAG